MTSNRSFYNRPSREGFDYIDTTNETAKSVYPDVRVAINDIGMPREVLPDGRLNPQQPVTMTLDQKFAPRIKPKSCTAVTDLLLPETSTMIYTDEFFDQPEARLFLQNIQPNVYSYNVDLTPINSNLGISYTPQIPPKFRDQVYSAPENATYPLYTRVDPQLIREDGVPARLMEQPVRNDWSAKYSSYNPAPGSINYEDIYDPRFTSYGDAARSYADIQTGNVQYYYSDLDAYRMPNFITRSKVDFIEFATPNGQIKPYYQRQASLDDVRPYVENTWMQDTTYFRENIMEEQMRKRNSQMWALRSSPLSRASHSRSKTSGAT